MSLYNQANIKLKVENHWILSNHLKGEENNRNWKGHKNNLGIITIHAENLLKW